MSELSKLIKLHQGDMSNRDLSAKSGLSRETVNRYVKGIHGEATDETLRALGKALGIPLQQLRVAAGHPAGELEMWVPPSEVNQLDKRERDVVERLIRVIAAAKRKDDYEPVQPAHSGTSSESGASGESNETQEAGLTDDPEVPDRAVTAARGAARRARKTPKVERKGS